MDDSKSPPEEKSGSHTGPARILGLPMWGGVSAIQIYFSLRNTGNQLAIVTGGRRLLLDP